MLLGLAMVAGSGWLIYGNKTEDEAAGSMSEAALLEMREVMDAAPKATRAPRSTSAPRSTLAPEGELPAATPIPEMPTMEIDGHAYIGYLEIPTIGVSLPVMSDWSYPKLRIAPCRYWGSAYDDSMVIMAHNYERHFGRIGALEIGDPVQFIDCDGNIFRYVVAAHEQLERTDVQKMLADSWDLTLFTCTYGGANRVTVRLTRVDAFAANGALEGDAESGPTQAGALVCRQTGGAIR